MQDGYPLVLQVKRPNTVDSVRVMARIVDLLRELKLKSIDQTYSCWVLLELLISGSTQQITDEKQRPVRVELLEVQQCVH